MLPTASRFFQTERRNYRTASAACVRAEGSQDSMVISQLPLPLRPQARRLGSPLTSLSQAQSELGSGGATGTEV